MKSWTLATAIGAGIAWTLGMVPSTIFSFIETSGPSEPMPTVSFWAMIGLAAAMGLILGPILGTPQWWVLKRFVKGAGWWIPANAAAWMLGMIVVFAASDILPADSSYLLILLTLILALTLAGALVGAVHGAVLVKLLDQ